MTYQEFKETIYKDVTNRYDSRASVHLSTYTKNNDVKLDGLSLSRKDSLVSPTVYLNDFYPLLDQGASIDEIVQKIIATFENAKGVKGFHPEEISDFSKIKGSVFFKLIGKESNQNLLKDVPYMEYLDLAIVFCIMVNLKDGEWGSILIQNHLLECWKLSKEDLFEFAKVNTYQLFQPSLTPIEQLLQRMISPEEQDLFPTLTPSFPMFVATNSRQANGATVICYPDFLRKISESMNTDFYILPSSIHEVILVPMDNGININDLTQMVQQVNKTQLEPEEVLSNHAYYYCRQKNKIMY